MYGRLTLIKKEIQLILAIRQSLSFFSTILLETPPSGPHIPSTLKKRTSPKKVHHIIANEQSSVAVFSVCLGAEISKSPLLTAGAGSLFLHLLMSFFCRQWKKDGKGGRMMVPTESPKAE